jgi:hypothetical protein
MLVDLRVKRICLEKVAPAPDGTEMTWAHAAIAIGGYSRRARWIARECNEREE